MWIAEKFQSNPDIAGSPRNSFRASVWTEFRGGKALNGLGGDKLTEPYQTKNAGESFFGSQTVGDKFHCRKGNSPDPQLRSPNTFKWRRMWNCENNQDVGLEAATH